MASKSQTVSIESSCVVVLPDQHLKRNKLFLHTFEICTSNNTSLPQRNNVDSGGSLLQLLYENRWQGALNFAVM